MKTPKSYRILFVVFLWVLMLATETIFARNVIIVLKSGKKVAGEMKEEETDFVLILTELGEIKISRRNIESVIYGVFAGGTDDSDEITTELLESNKLNDHVVVHLQNGELMEGYLIAKSATMVMLRSELGKLTVPKEEIKRLEYVSDIYAERGEPVEVKLTSGVKLNGYLYHEDRDELTITTELGRLQIDKKDLESIEYNVSVGFSRPGKRKEIYSGSKITTTLKGKPIDRRQDSIDFGYSSQFGENYSGGLMFTYRNRFLLKSYKTFRMNLEANLGAAGFPLNKNILSQEQVPGSITASGLAFISTLGLGVPFHLFASEKAAYVFYITPRFDSHLVYTSLKKTYPSFPALNSEVRSTKLRFGFGSQIGMEWILSQNWRVGISFNMNYLFNASDFNSIALHVGTRLF